ncbi:MAG TPA: AzlD domain-containing protein [Rhodobacteraceae bacterium]|jgi:branched-subunit amino acid transport protein|nr:AzlD domain-containing protein [Paracoccaceae bacterium]HBG97643.1 AzlD domain-containing protein [Paracoccaceae bacterium]
MSYSDLTIWAIIVALGLGTWGLRFSFLGLIGSRAMPEWLLRHLRYTAVAVLPGLVAPLVVWPQATGGTLDPPRLAAALATVGIGLISRNMLAAIAGGMGTLYALQALTG